MDSSQENDPIKLRNMADQNALFCDTLHKKAVEPQPCQRNLCKASLYKPLPVSFKERPKITVIKEAIDFIAQYYESVPDEDKSKAATRLREVVYCIDATGSYDLTREELEFGAKLAWRNAPRCVGRIQWSNLKVFDYRNVKTTADMFKAICSHLEYSTNGGLLQSAITIFPHVKDDSKPIRVWNSQFVQYAGYRNLMDGSIIGDPSSVEFTDICTRLGWKSKKTHFDVLPMVLQIDGNDPELFEYPSELVLQVVLKHPNYPRFEELGLKWFAVPAVANMAMDCGGLFFTACPFNGWYQASEIARDLCDYYRYDKSKEIAQVLDLDTNNVTSLWLDKVFLETNVAVLHSFMEQGVTITDHHSVASSFMSFMSEEYKNRGGCPVDWVWVVPPISSSMTPVFHQEMLNYKLKPSYEYMENAWINHKWKRTPSTATSSTRTSKTGRGRTFKSAVKSVALSNRLMGEARSRRIPVTVIYATETGRSERFANQLSETLDAVFQPRVVRMDKYNIKDLPEEKMLFVVLSTFGNGSPPKNGLNFFSCLDKLQEDSTLRSLFSEICFTVFAVGSRAYPKFCAAGYDIDERLEALGFKRIHPIGLGDALKGQEVSFDKWSRCVLQAACNDAKLELTKADKEDLPTNVSNFRLIPMPEKKVEDPASMLSKIHDKNVFQMEMISNRNLQNPESERKTQAVALSEVDGAFCNRIDYLPGDHVAVFPKNDEARVNKIIARTVFGAAVGADDVARLEVRKQNRWVAETRLPETTLRLALTYLLDITAPPDQMFMETLATFAECPEDKEKLSRLAGDIKEYDDWKVEFHQPLDELLAELVSLQVPIESLISQLPLLEPRYYSISSSVKSHPGQVHLTAGVVEFYAGNDGKGPKRSGLCSTWLKKLEMGELVHVFIRANDHFHLPDDRSKPMILIGPGTGIAPFMSFFNHEMFEKSEHNRDVTFYFGCRRSDHDQIYTKEIKEFLNENVISKYRVAFSREPGNSKTYVQDLVQEDATSIYNKIIKDDGHLYICGALTMASDVEQILCKIICEGGNVSAEEASDIIEKLVENKRYHKDIY